jgi:hypothetical protein
MEAGGPEMATATSRASAPLAACLRRTEAVKDCATS